MSAAGLRLRSFFCFVLFLPLILTTFFSCRRASAGLLFAPDFDNSFFWSCRRSLTAGLFLPLILTTLIFLSCRRSLTAGLLFLFFVFVKTSLFWLLFFFELLPLLTAEAFDFFCFVLPLVPITEIKHLKALKQLF